MTFGYHLLAWRRHRSLTQVELAKKVGLSRPYFSRVEQDKVDPSLSLIRRLALALDLRLGELLEDLPTNKPLSNEELDSAARGALQPGSEVAGGASSYARPLSRLLKERRMALGLFKPRGGAKDQSKNVGLHALRRMRVELGENQWQALLKRIDKHATFIAPKNENT